MDRTEAYKIWMMWERALSKASERLREVHEEMTEAERKFIEASQYCDAAEEQYHRIETEAANLAD